MAESPSRSNSSKPLLVIVTGLSGAGMSTCVKALEDQGFFCIDNLPIETIWSVVEMITKGKTPARGWAFGMDIRDNEFSRKFPEIKKKLAEFVTLDVMFFTAEDKILATRFSETRRRHPLITRGADILKAVARERKLLKPVEDAADVIIDTSRWSPHRLARVVEERFRGDLPPRKLYVEIMSFGFKYGYSRPFENVYDVRFVRNPHFEPELKPKTGLDPEIRDYVFADPHAQEFLARIESLLRFLLPRYFEEGKHYFRIGVGCTGGKHRSVAFAEELGRLLTEHPIPNVDIKISHRDIERHTSDGEED